MHKAMFLDRDGLINKSAPLHEYIQSWEQFEFLPNVQQAIRKLNDAGYFVIIVTNQRGVARGLMTLEDVSEIHKQMCSELDKAGAHIDGIYVCPHENGTCNCRKPDTGLLLMAEQDFDIDKAYSWLIGDSETDRQAALKYGIRAIVTTDLLSAVNQILEDEA